MAWRNHAADPLRTGQTAIVLRTSPATARCRNPSARFGTRFAEYFAFGPSVSLDADSVTMRNISWFIGLWLAVVASGCGDGPTPTAPSVVLPDSSATGTSGSTSTGTGSASTIGYTDDIKPILDADCIRCHNNRTHDGNVDLSSYAGVLRTLRPGDGNSVLIRATRAGGSMSGEWRGSAAAKAELVRRWIVDFNASQTR